MLLFVSCVLGAEDAHAGHDHSNPYDWAGIFETKAASHTFRVQEVNGKVRIIITKSTPFQPSSRPARRSDLA